MKQQHLLLLSLGHDHWKQFTPIKCSFIHIIKTKVKKLLYSSKYVSTARAQQQNQKH